MHARILCQTLAVLGLCSLAFPAVEIDPQTVLADLRAYYRGHDRAERIDIRAFSDGAVGGDSILLRIAPPASAKVSCGGYELAIEGPTLRVVHALDAQSYWESASSAESPLAALPSDWPPLPLPHFALAWAEEPGSALTPYARNIRWTSAEIRDETGAPHAILRGRGPRADVEIVVEGATGRLLRMQTTIDAGSTRLELACTPVGADEAPALGIDISRRQLVRSLAELKPREGDIRPGDPLPELPILEFRDESERRFELMGPLVLVFMRDWKSAGSPRETLEAASIAAEQTEGLRFAAVIALEIIETESRVLIDAASIEIRPIRLAHAYSTEATIGRFTSARSALVVIDREGRVRLVEDGLPRGAERERIIEQALKIIDVLAEPAGPNPPSP